MPNLWCPKTLNPNLIGHIYKQPKPWQTEENMQAWPLTARSLLVAEADRLREQICWVCRSAWGMMSLWCHMMTLQNCGSSIGDPLLWMNTCTRTPETRWREGHGEAGLLDYLGEQMLAQATRSGHFNVKAAQMTFAAKRLPGVWVWGLITPEGQRSERPGACGSSAWMQASVPRQAGASPQSLRAQPC